MHQVYDDLPYPFPCVPLPGEPVTTATIEEVILPLLETVAMCPGNLRGAGQRGDLDQRPSWQSVWASLPASGAGDYLCWSAWAREARQARQARRTRPSKSRHAGATTGRPRGFPEGVTEETRSTRVSFHGALDDSQKV